MSIKIICLIFLFCLFLSFVILFLYTAFVILKGSKVESKLKKILIEEKRINDTIDFDEYMNKRISKSKLFSSIEVIYDQDDTKEVRILKELIVKIDNKCGKLYLIIFVNMMFLIGSVFLVGKLLGKISL